MLYLTWSFIVSSLLSLNGIVFGYVAASPRTLVQRFPAPIITATRAYPTHQVSYNAHSCAVQKNASAAISTTESPQSYPNYCLLGRSEPGCLTTKTWDGPPIPAITEQCVLWDESCPGNICTAAPNFFSDTLWKMTEKPCWKGMDNTSLPCTQYEPTGVLSAMRDAKSWMRTPQCSSIGIDFDATNLDGGCCGTGYILAKNVDVYYWPEPNATTGCMDIIGDTVNPPEQGATIDSGLTYWGCTAIHPLTSTSISDIIGPSGNVVSSVTVTIVQSIITTAQMTSIGSIAFKQSLYNPWTPPACSEETSIPSHSIRHGDIRSSQAFIHARGHSLVVPSSVTQQDGLPVSTVVSGTFTL